VIYRYRIPSLFAGGSHPSRNSTQDSIRGKAFRASGQETNHWPQMPGIVSNTFFQFMWGEGLLGRTFWRKVFC
jgi:hypothetical protein